MRSFLLNSDTRGLRQTAMMLENTAAVVASGRDSVNMRLYNRVIEINSPPVVREPLDMTWLQERLEVVRARVPGVGEIVPQLSGGAGVVGNAASSSGC